MPGPPRAALGRPFFQRELLELALSKSPGRWQIEMLATQTWPRQVREMRDGHAEVAPLPALEAAYADFKLLRVDFPLRRGLLGLRRLVVRADRLAEFEAVRDLATLQRRFRMGYVHDWVDLPEMQRLGFRVVVERSTEAMYAGLRSGSIDFLSRGVHEVVHELRQESAAGPGLAVLPKLALFYPLDDCYYVAPGRAELQRVIDAGLHKASLDGSYRSLFRRHYDTLLGSLSGVSLLELKGYPLPAGLELKQFDARSLIPPPPRT